MTTSTSRLFEDHQAVRAATPLWIALGGPSGSGKSLSALRLAEGIRRVTGGPTYCVDTEADRLLFYAPREGEKATPPQTFDFRHISFQAPFASLDYLAAVQFAAEKGAKVVVIDQQSSEHDGPGGVSEQFEAAVEKLAKGDAQRAERVKFTAWNIAKAGRKQMVQQMLQMKVSVITTFRAKQQLKISKGHDPVPMGYMPITGDELIFEYPLRLLLPAGCDGVPSLSPVGVGEKEWVRVPAQFRSIVRPGQQINEEMGLALARWAAGDTESTKGDEKQAAAEERKALLTEISEALQSRHPGQSDAAKKARMELRNAALRVQNWKQAEDLPVPVLRAALLDLQHAPGDRTREDDFEAEERERAEREAADELAGKGVV